MVETARIARSLDGHDAFERDEKGYSVSTTALDAHVRIAEGNAPDGDASTAVVTLEVTVRVPTIDEVVAGETVAPVIQNGWLETFERRVEDVGGVTRTQPSPPTVSVDAAREDVIVETTLPANGPGVVDDVKAIVDYVEGTFVVGLIPGYTYREPAAGLIERARSAGDR